MRGTKEGRNIPCLRSILGLTPAERDIYKRQGLVLFLLFSNRGMRNYPVGELRVFVGP
jgi:hypothetical protein